MKYALAFVSLCYFVFSAFTSTSIAGTRKGPIAQNFRQEVALKQLEQKEFMDVRLQATHEIDKPISTLASFDRLDALLVRSEALLASSNMNEDQKTILQGQIDQLNTLREMTKEFFANRLEQCFHQDQENLTLPSVYGLEPKIKLSVDQEMSDKLYFLETLAFA